MIDRQLLELAAKAAGYEICHDLETKDCLAIKIDYCNHAYWNPLDDNGDALRLVVKLGLDVGINPHSVWVIDIDRDNWIVEQKNNDPYAATRRAIVRAAAKIGKNIGEQV